MYFKDAFVLKNVLHNLGDFLYQPIPLTPIDGIDVTIIVDNFISSLLPNNPPVNRISSIKNIKSNVTEGAMVKDRLKAEHGFSAWVSIDRGKNTHNLMFDTGVSPTGAIENLERLGINPKNAEMIVLSHGHYDHTLGLDGLLRKLRFTSMPLILHPEFWNKRRIVIPGRRPTEIPSISRTSLVEGGFEIIQESRQPSFLLEDSVLITGEIDRTTTFENGFPGQEAFIEYSWQPDPLTLDDQALIVNIKNKGLVILTGCGHSGIINLAKYAQKLTGIKKIHALVGGFHLPDSPHFLKIIPETIKNIKHLSVDWIVPTHCTGLEALSKFSQEFPESFIQNSVGSKYTFNNDIH